MNRSQIEKFATWARTYLRDQVAAKVARFGISANELETAQFVSGGMSVAGFTYDSHEAGLYKELHAHLSAKINGGTKLEQAVEDLIDEAAYTWFNRLTALRFMEVNGYITRALSSSTDGLVDPDLLQHAGSLIGSGEFPGVDLDDLDRWREQGEGVTYRNLLIAQCNELAKPLPFLFGESKRFIELLLPDNLLSQNSIVKRIVEDIPEDDWRKIEIIGWLYQFYISERKDEVFSTRGAVAAQDIPAVTQLFTPHWIVRYMVENSLGRRWIDAHPDSLLREHMPYFLEGESVEANSTNADPDLNPQDLTVLDPACGSGHILVYAFDLLYQIYLERGYAEREIPTLILEHNLYGLDIDERAAQLASFALIMKARKKDRRILRDPPRLNVTWTEPTKGWNFSYAPELDKKDWQPLVDAFEEAGSLGSLISSPHVDIKALDRQLNSFKAGNHLNVESEEPRLRHLIQQAALLAGTYEVVVTNPPYMGSSAFNKTLKDFVNASYPRSKRDLFAVFMERSLELTDTNGIMGMINQHSWMFLSSYQQLREHLLNNFSIQTMLHLGTRAFPEISGEMVQSTAFTVSKSPPTSSGDALYVRLVEFGNSEAKKEHFLSGESRFTVEDQGAFLKIPGSPIGYWASDRLLETFVRAVPLGSLATIRKGIYTGDNNRFLRLWHEVEYPDIEMAARSISESEASNKKWYFYTKGGTFRRFYGNNEHVVNFQQGGEELGSFRGSGIGAAKQIFFKKAMVWSGVTTAGISFRTKPAYIQNDDVAPALIPNDNSHSIGLLSLLNSNVADPILQILNPTQHYQVGDLRRFPALSSGLKDSQRAAAIERAVTISRWDWDNFENSWDFNEHPLVRGDFSKLADAFDGWTTETETAFYELKRLEEENNYYWINAYGLQGDLAPAIPDDRVAIRRADLRRDIRSLLSYAVGCMLGRYSLTSPGLQFAGGTFKQSAFDGKFLPDKDGILPITDSSYFDGDMTDRFVEFLRVAYGDEYLHENISFVADALVRNDGETPIERLRRYFLNEFVSDHVRIYGRRPIYWFFTSGKERAFGAFVYLHRYGPDTLARMRNDYVLPLQGKIENEIKHTEHAIETATSAAATRREERRLKQLRDQMAELLNFQDKLLHKADQRISIDLDDGVAYNYSLFEGLVYEEERFDMEAMLKASKWKRDLLSETEESKAK